MRLYNTLSRKTEELQPLEPGVVRMYSCGPTVYRYAHIGNMRTYLMADWIRRGLELQGLRVIQVKNITDVGHMRQEMLEQGEDRMIASALAEGKTPQEIAEFYTQAFHRDEAKLGVTPATHSPKATDHVPEMVEIVRRLQTQGYAYEVEGNVYFDVGRFPDYGKLSGNVQESLLEGRAGGGRPTEARPEGLHPVEGRGGGSSPPVAQPLGPGLPRLAHRVLRHVHQVPGRAAGHSHRRR